MRCYRPAQPGGRWRWVLYDMDHGRRRTIRSVERLCDGHFPSAPYLPQLLGHPELRPLLLARLSTLLATVFSEAQSPTSGGQSVSRTCRPAHVRSSAVEGRDGGAATRRDTGRDQGAYYAARGVPAPGPREVHWHTRD
ncbi:MAG: CotH kinase family protein [Flavobacteriales bacterium]|nr:CotH kinase family protein [Flavobacteriales bacterium]